MIKTNKSTEIALIAAVKKTNKNKIWFNKYFDLVKEVLIDCDIDENSPKISMTITEELKMPIKIGNRCIICPNDRGDEIGLILPLEFRKVISGYPTAIIDRDYFLKNGKQKALWINFESNIILSADKTLFDNWKSAVKNEVERTKKTRFRKSNNPFYYNAVMDIHYRKKILG